MRRLHPLILLAALLFAIVLWQRHAPAPAAVHPSGGTPTTQGTAVAARGFLPGEAQATLHRIARGGPFDHDQDGVVFGNYEGRLPQAPRGYYHEYTVETPGARTRGARRIITGGNPPVIYYYTGDHYRSFHRFELNR